MPARRLRASGKVRAISLPSTSSTPLAVSQRTLGVAGKGVGVGAVKGTFLTLISCFRENLK